VTPRPASAARQDPTARVLLLAAGLLTVAVMLIATLPASQAPSWRGWLGVGVLLGAFAVCEGVVLHFDIGDEAYTASISEIPLVAGLLLMDPGVVVGARVIGALLALWLWRRQPPVKLLFNTCSFLLEAAVPAVLITHLPMHGVQGWAAIAVAAILGNITSGLSVSAAIALSGIPVRLSHLGRLVSEAAVFAGFSATVAVLGVAAYRYEPGLGLPIAVAVLGLAFMYVGSSRMRSRLLRLTALQTAIRDFTPAAGYEDTIRALLEQARDKLRAGSAVLHLVEPGGVTTLRYRYDGTALVADLPELAVAVRAGLRGLGAGTLLRSASATALEGLGLAGVTDAVVVPVTTPQHQGFLAVCERRSDHTVFSAEDLTALQGIAQHGSVSLANATLIERLLHESRHDALTGLPNRVHFHEELTRRLALEDCRAAVLLADLDGFKDVNDALGHHTGDLLLQRVAHIVAEALPADALLARLGGDEFAILLPAGEHALELAEQVRQVLALPLRIEGVPISVGASIGVAVTPVHGTEVEEVLRSADVAMYEAKAGPGIVLYDASRDTSDATKLSLAGDLREGVRRGELRLHVQPKARAADAVTVGVEALVRWQHPSRGLIYPDEFITLAERTGVLPEISAWVLAAALDAVQTWQLAGLDLSIAVNVSPQDLHDPNLPDRVIAALRARDLAPSLLTLEITEGTIMTDPERVRGVLSTLREHGVRISVDDFGTGHSSLAYLGNLPVDEVKVDKAFVRDVLTDRGHRAVVSAVTRIAHDLDLVVVAEGVEDLETWQHLVSLGAHQVQGYHLARPMPVVALIGWLQAQTPAAAAEPALRPLRSVER
jgi:diguanylate cyclase (GGDEF)-like protein